MIYRRQRHVQEKSEENVNSFVHIHIFIRRNERKGERDGEGAGGEVSKNEIEKI